MDVTSKPNFLYRIKSKKVIKFRKVVIEVCNKEWILIENHYKYHGNQLRVVEEVAIFREKHVQMIIQKITCRIKSN